MSPVISVSVVTPFAKLYEGDAVSVSVPGKDGYIEFKPLHAPLITELGMGTLLIENPSSASKIFHIIGGYAEIHEDKMIILADSANNIEDINLDQIFHDRERARRTILDSSVEMREKEKAEKALQRAESLIRACQHQTGEGREQ